LSPQSCQNEGDIPGIVTASMMSSDQGQVEYSQSFGHPDFMRQPLGQGKKVFDIEMGWPKWIPNLAVLTLSFKLTTILIAIAGPGSLFGQIVAF
jgi:hypothetical protein